MKAWVLIILVLILIFSLNGWSNQHVFNTTQHALDLLDKERESIESDDWAQAIQDEQSLTEMWDMSKAGLEMLIDHVEVENIDIVMSRIRVMVEENNREESLTDLSELERNFEHIRLRYSFRWENVL